MPNLLTLEDFKGKRLNPNSTPFETLLFVLEVGLQKLKDQENAAANSVSDESSREKPQPQKKVTLKKPTKKLNRLLRKQHTSSDIEGDNSKRKSSDAMSNEEWIKHLKSKKKKQQQQRDESNPPLSSLPEEFEREITEKCGGSRPNQIVRLIQKTIYRTDVSKNHGRLSIPCSQLESFEFLQDHEITRLRQEKGIKVCLIYKRRRTDEVSPPHPLIENKMVELGQWNLHKDDFRKVNPQYVLRTGWNEVVSDVQLRQGDTIQVWAFRDIHNQLCMALVQLG